MHFTDIAFFTNWSFVAPIPSKTISATFPIAFAHSMSLYHIVLILPIFQSFSLLLYLLWWSVISDFWCYYCIWRHYELCPYKMINGEGNGNPLQYFCLEIPWTEEPGRVQSMGLWRVGHDWSDSAAGARRKSSRGRHQAGNMESNSHFRIHSHSISQWIQFTLVINYPYLCIIGLYLTCNNFC